MEGAMNRVLLGVAVILAIPGLASAKIFTLNCRLDHALWPEHDPKVVVAGEIGLSDKDGELRFSVHEVILGAKSYKGQTLRVPVRSFMWPSTLVSFEKGTFCILVLLPWNVNEGVEWGLYTVVPGRKKAYPPARDSRGASAVLAEELLAQLKSERSVKRQRVLLLQLAPVLAKDKAKAVEEHLKSPDPWVRRSALAAVTYATEDAKYLEALAKDVQAYFAQTKETEWVNGLEPGVRMRPKTLLLEHYFFLEKSTWTWGTRWDGQEAAKHLRILRAMFKIGVIEDWVRKRLTDE
jgi:hypothetical protein